MMMTPQDQPRRRQSRIAARPWSERPCAHWWRCRIESRRTKSIADLTEQQGVREAYGCRGPAFKRLAGMIEAIPDGRPVTTSIWAKRAGKRGRERPLDPKD
jgi:hypothetical protein